MAEKFVVKAVKRKGRGKNDARRLRRLGKIPVTVYGGGEDTVAVEAELSDLAAIIRSDTGANTLFSLDVEGVGESRVIFQDRQIDPVKGRLLHADLRRLAKGEKIEVTVPVHLVGSPRGVYEEGGVLEQQLREIKVLCTPSNIPESIDVDVSNLGANESIHVSEIETGGEFEIQESPDTLIASVVFVKEEVEAVAGEDKGVEPDIVGEKTIAPEEDSTRESEE